MDNQLWEQLRAEVVRKREAYSVAAEKFNDLIARGPSGLPSPDGATRIAQAGKAMRRALQEYVEAVRRRTDYATFEALDDGWTERPKDPDNPDEGG